MGPPTTRQTINNTRTTITNRWSVITRKRLRLTSTIWRSMVICRIISTTNEVLTFWHYKRIINKGRWLFEFGCFAVLIICLSFFSPLNFTGRNNLVKRDRGILLDVGLSPYGYNSGDISAANILSKEPSPRVLPPPQWLTGNLKITSQGKTTQIGKRGITDWKTISSSNPALSTSIPIPGKDDLFTLPNCPGASTSPYKGLKKKLSPMATMSHDSQHYNTSPVWCSLSNIFLKFIRTAVDLFLISIF